MRYEEPVIRPPSEAQSLILQVSVGCSHNRCTFCGTFKRKRFRIRPLQEIRQDLEEVRPYAAFVERVFFADGDALIVPQRMLVPLMEVVRNSFPRLRRIGVYGNTKSILKKTPRELRALKDLGLGIVYLGVETGDQETLDRIGKGTTLDQTAEAAERIKDAGILLSTTVMLGIGGVERSRIHAQRTGQFLSRIQPDYVGALSLMIVPSTPLAEDEIQGRFQVPGSHMLLEELHTVIEHIEDGRMYFASNHASNYLPLRGWLPQEKNKLLAAIEYVLRQDDPSLLRPEYMRGL